MSRSMKEGTFCPWWIVSYWVEAMNHAQWKNEVLQTPQSKNMSETYTIHDGRKYTQYISQKICIGHKLGEFQELLQVTRTMRIFKEKNN